MSVPYGRVQRRNRTAKRTRHDAIISLAYAEAEADAEGGREWEAEAEEDIVLGLDLGVLGLPRRKRKPKPNGRCMFDGNAQSPRRTGSFRTISTRRGSRSRASSRCARAAPRSRILASVRA